MPDKTNISVIIPTYNRAQLVTKAIDSVLTQTYQDYEIIVVDDGSIDNTEEVVNSFEDKRIRYIKFNENRGAPFARNYGVQIAKGQYISLLDSDDYYLPNKFAVQIKALERDPNAGLVYSNILVESTNTKTKIKYKPKTLKSGFLFKEIITWSLRCRLPTWLMKRDCYLSIGGFDEELPVFQDRDFIERFSFRYKLLAVPEPVAVVVFHKDTRIDGSSAKIKEYAINRILEKITKLVKESDYSPVLIKKTTSIYYYITAKAYLAENNLLEARKYFFKAFSNNPFNYMMYPYLVGSSNHKIYHLMKRIKNILTKSISIRPYKN